MPLKDYLEFVEPLRLPCAGKEYELPPVGVRDGVTLIRGLAQDAETPASDEDLARILLGPALEQMQADNVPPGFITKALLTALADFRNGRAAAEEFWDTVADPKALLDLMRQTPTGPEESQPSTSTGEATGTPSPASGTGTKTSRPSSPRSKAKTAASRSSGSTSSSSGRSSRAASTKRSASTS